MFAQGGNLPIVMRGLNPRIRDFSIRAGSRVAGRHGKSFDDS